MPFDLTRGAPLKIAIIGGGISGLSAAWLLSGHHQVTLYESAARLGGHARTVMAGRRGDVAVDTGFIVFNYANYPHLSALFRDLDVPVQRSDMSFGVSLGNGRVEYALRSVGALFAQRANLMRPGFYRMIRDILRFNARAEALAKGQPDLTIGQLIAQMRLGDRFRDDYLYPICGAIWSTPASQIGDFPAETLLRFLANHALMSKGGQHQWWTVSGGSASYVEKLATQLQRRGVVLRPATPVRRVQRDATGVTVQADGAAQRFDQVIMACHADQTLALLADPLPPERAALGAVRFQDNRAVLHADPRVMPARRACWSSWIYRADDPQSDRAVGVTYWMNRLQSLPEDDPLFVSLNPEAAIDPALIYDQTTFRHPVFDQAAIRAQASLRAMQGTHHTWFAGAWLRNGFHEDGFASAMRIARHLLPAKV
ncbi:NAD(P)/FAD-dependent oxidoreductase [Paracoccus shanxieyensis]|uniref:FAD-dependent oxidoreductase n=1 Tax=Paracoccus shanxieyensis TaxID=2675752 RepID=A0A6L6J0Q9_9RHOB|nr:FAD-dependent oxidoreductase [Paracoccus shanxieyensis]MTH64840.1 FAD-dependent oxidoreductase [Paracoccus shanxieyensis]MTH87927.1 FAD-dependent oxidoreductase [Paracoccus shanxieyensis]